MAPERSEETKVWGEGGRIVCDQWLANGTIINLLSVAPERSEETKVWGGGQTLFVINGLQMGP